MPGKLWIDKRFKIICDLYEDGISSPDIARKFGVSPQAIRGILKRRNIARRSNSDCQRIYNFKQDFFSIINNETKAYWLGFIAADGCIYKNALVIGLAKKDKSHLEMFKKTIGSGHKLTFIKSNQAFSLHIKSMRMVSDLSKLGINPRKTKTLKWPSIQERLTHHYIRGYFDGDGSFYVSKRIRSMMEISFVSKKEHLKSIGKFIEDKINIKYKGVYKHRNSKIVAYLKYGGRNQVKKIYDLLYKGSHIFLERKKSKIFSAIQY